MMAGAESVPFGAGVTMQVLLVVNVVAEESDTRKREMNDKRRLAMMKLKCKSRKNVASKEVNRAS